MRRYVQIPRRVPVPPLAIRGNTLALMQWAEDVARSETRLGFVTPAGGGGDLNTMPFGPPQPISDGSPMSPGFTVPLFQGGPTPLQNPDTRPGAWPGLNPATAPQQFNTLPVQVPSAQPASTKPLIVSPTSGVIPSPATVAAAAAPAPSWFDQQMIPGVKNSYLVLGGIAALLLFGGKKK